MYMDSLSVCMSGHHCVPGTQADQKRVSGTGITDGFEAPCGFRKSNPGPLEDQQVH